MNIHTPNMTLKRLTPSDFLLLLAISFANSVIAEATVTETDFLNTSFLNSKRYIEEDHGKSKPWGKVIGFSLLINLATLTGVLLLIPAISRQAGAWLRSICWNKAVPDPTPKLDENGIVILEQDQTEIDERQTAHRKEDRWHLLDIFIPSFASGALLSTSIFLVIPDALSLIQTHISADEEATYSNVTALDEEHHTAEFKPAAVWRFGASLLGGFLLPLFLDALFSNKQDHYEGDRDQNESLVSDEEKASSTCNDLTEAYEGTVENHSHDTCKHTCDHRRSTPKAKKVNLSLVMSILLGDALHNFCDGVFVGIALSTCESATAYTIIAITLYHEIAQELADYFLLTRHAGLRPCVALPLNFCSGLSIMLGGIVVLSLPVSDMIIGVILSIASGVYIYIAACECLPRVNAVVKSSKDRFTTMFMFIMGAVPIGLALLNHAHCEADDH